MTCVMCSTLDSITRYYFSLILDAVTIITSTFGDKAEVPSKHWNAYVSETRYDLETSTACRVLAQFESWDYSAFEESAMTCHLANFTNEIIISENSEEGLAININANLLEPFQNNFFVSRHSHRFPPFIYKHFPATKNTYHCSVHCFFDPDDNCDFHFLYGSDCYLGNFNTENTVGAPGGHHYTYIFMGKSAVS